jgi:hypothetical protein
MAQRTKVRKGEGGCILDEIQDLVEPIERSFKMAGLGRLARGERRNLRILTECQDVDANDWPRRARLVLREARMAKREARWAPRMDPLLRQRLRHPRARGSK